MRQRTKWRVAAIIIIGLVIFEGFARAAEVNEPNKPYAEVNESNKPYKGEVRFRYDWIGVNGDRGRFREDNWMTDGSTGGLDWLHMESTRPDKNGYEWLLEGRALDDYDYEMSLLIKKPDSHYLKIDFSGLRRYFDGSDEGHRWSRSLDRRVDDRDLFVDRRNYNIEFGLTPAEGPQWVFGWHRLEKDGEQALLRSARDGDVPKTRAIPNIVNMSGVTDTIYGEVSQTFADKYNLRVRQEFEQYHDNPYGPLNRTSSLTSTNNGKDDLGYTNWRTMVMFDSFLDKRTYVTADYMFNYLTNNSTSKYRQPASVPSLRLEEFSVDNTKTTNVYGLGYRRADILEVKKLDLSAGVRIEDSKTDAQSYYWTSTAPNFFTLESNLDETRVAEVLRLVYKGINKTTLSFDAQLEEREMDWDSQRIPTYTSDRKADIDFLDQIYTLKALHRFNNDIKLTVAFKIKDLYRNYTELLDLNPGAYPGFLGDYRIKGDDLLIKTDFRLNDKTSATLLYQFVHEAIDFELGGRTSDQEIHRGSGSISFNPVQNLFLVGTFMLENRTIDTPGAGATTGPQGEGAYNFSGKSYSLMLDGTYAFNEKTSSTLGFQHTEAIGNADASGDYVFDKVGLSLKHKLAANQTVGLGYQFYNYNSRNGDNLDYSAHHAFVTYTYTF